MTHTPYIDPHALVGRMEGRVRKQQPFLELREVGSFDVRCVSLELGRHVIGRSPDLAIALPHISVSRYHAELASDPYGRWWIHDLGSTNGTHVNGTRITQRMLNAGDTIQTGDYVIKFRLPGTASERISPVTEPPSSRPGSLPPPSSSGVGATRVGASHLTAAAGFSRALMQVDKKRQRLESLLYQCVGDGFPGSSAWVVRMRRNKSARLYMGPLRRESSVASGLAQPGEIELLATEHQAALFDSPGPHALQAKDAHFLAVAIESEPDGMFVLYVELPQFARTEQWHALLALLTNAYQQANEVREAREHDRYTAVVDRELDMARQIQERVVPRSPETKGVEIAIGYEPCQWVGGDYVDSVELADGRVLLVCADVCGKGLQASLTASSLHTLLYATVETETELCRIAERMNRYLCRFLPERSFVTFAGLALDPETGEIECLNAGHPPPLWVSGGQVRSLQSSVNPALGIIDSEMLSERQELAPGDVLLLYSDGVIEAEDAERRPLGAARLAHEFEKTVADLNEASVQTVLESLSKTVSVHRGSLMAADDTTFLVARWQGDQAPPSGITTLIPEPF